MDVGAPRWPNTPFSNKPNCCNVRFRPVLVYEIIVSGAARPGGSSGCSGPTVRPSVLVKDVKLALLDENRHTHTADEFIKLVTT